MPHYKIFISYRRAGTADKAEHLLSLLEKSGYKGRVSFDRENFDGTFDLEILRRIDRCKDFILVVGESTFANISMDEAEAYKHYAKCSVEEFDVIQRKLLSEGRSIDFVRFEIARAIEKKKNIVPVVLAASDKFDFDRLQLPDDISQIKRIQAVFYTDSKNFLFKSVVPDVIRRLKTPRLIVVKLLLAAFVLLALIFSALYSWQYYACVTAFEKCRTVSDYESLLDGKLPDGIRKQAHEALNELNELRYNYVYTNNEAYGRNVYGENYTDSLMVFWSDDLSFNQLSVIRGIFNNMMSVPDGSFMMGTDNFMGIEGPCHKVTLTEDYYMSKYELTNKEWFAVMNDSVVMSKDSCCPVVSVSWNQCQGFIQRLNEAVGINGWIFSLPTEAQWEYAAKGGKDFVYSGSDDLAAVMDINSNRAVEVGRMACNGYELYDMTGNVKEWCLDGDWRTYTEEPVTDPLGDIHARKHIIRGGSYQSKDDIDFLKIVYRDTYSADASAEDIGLRLALIKKK